MLTIDLNRCGKTMNNKLILSWRPRAQLDKESIALYLGVEQRSFQAALRVISAIDETLDRLCMFPDMGKRFESSELEEKGYRSALSKPYIIVYRCNDTTLTVYRIIHERFNIDDYTLLNLDESLYD